MPGTKMIFTAKNETEGKNLWAAGSQRTARRSDGKWRSIGGFSPCVAVGSPHAGAPHHRWSRPSTAALRGSHSCSQVYANTFLRRNLQTYFGLRIRGTGSMNLITARSLTDT
jgi:hypothetical protein